MLELELGLIAALREQRHLLRSGRMFQQLHTTLPANRIEEMGGALGWRRILPGGTEGICSEIALSPHQISLASNPKAKTRSLMAKAQSRHAESGKPVSVNLPRDRLA